MWLVTLTEWFCKIFVFPLLVLLFVGAVLGTWGLIFWSVYKGLSGL